LIAWLTRSSFVVAAFLLLAGIAPLLVFALIFRVWVRGLLGGVRVSLLDVLGMRLRGNPPGLLVDAHLVLKQRGIESSIAEVETTYVAHKGRGFTPSGLADEVVQCRGATRQMC
jgi:uncharacterized protein YqfA (UPF0365 family)